MPKTREWFLPKAKGFALKHVQTKTGAVTYTTVGAIVPVRELISEVEGAVRFKVSVDGAMEEMKSRRGSRVQGRGVSS
jgi:hypothetical protein